MTLTLDNHRRLLINVTSLAAGLAVTSGWSECSWSCFVILIGAIPVFFDTTDGTLRTLRAPWGALLLADNDCIDFGDRMRQPGWFSMATSRMLCSSPLNATG